MNREELLTGLQEIASLRKQGDGLAKLNRHALASEMWNRASQKAEMLVSSLAGAGEDLVEDRAELFGVQAGLLKRLGRESESLASYLRGAQIEDEGKLGSTYNRMNAIRSALFLGPKTIGTVMPDLVAVRKVLENRLKDPEVASDGWLWADLGDVCTLLGDFAGAEESYAAYARKAGSEEIRITRESIETLRTRLSAREDPDVHRLAAGLEAFDRAVTMVRS